MYLKKIKIGNVELDNNLILINIVTFFNILDILDFLPFFFLIVP
jgi:hypothetical protein